MKRLRYPAFLLLLILFGGCRHDPAVEALLDRAALLQQSAPDSALLLLRSLDGVEMRRAEDARRRLLLASIHYAQPESREFNAALLQPALRWFDRCGKPVDQAACHLLWAAVQGRSGQHEEEMRSYTRALQAAERIAEDSLRHRQLARIQFSLSQRYHEQNDPESEFAAIEQSIAHAEACRDREQVIASRMMYAQHLTSKDCAAAVEVLQPLVEMRESLALHRPEIAALISLVNIHLHARLGDWEADRLALIYQCIRADYTQLSGSSGRCGAEGACLDQGMPLRARSRYRGPLIH